MDSAKTITQITSWIVLMINQAQERVLEVSFAIVFNGVVEQVLARLSSKQDSREHIQAS